MNDTNNSSITTILGVVLQHIQFFHPSVFGKILFTHCDEGDMFQLGYFNHYQVIADERNGACENFIVEFVDAMIHLDFLDLDLLFVVGW